MELLEEMEKCDFGVGNEDGYDAVVVGSGYGGSAAACRMSMAGIRVCLIEKGRRWEARDFPTDVWKIISAFRMENKNLGISFGAKDALFQVYEQDNCLAAVATGLGGGSLVNAGVMLPTPISTRRNPKWPKEWERDWESCEASASSMLNIQTVPNKFPSSIVMAEVIGQELEETCQSSIKLSVNFDIEQANSSCLACGNCLAGCPYNAKNSTDKNYISAAIQAGCVVKTECQARYVVENSDDFRKEERINRRRRRRWLVFLNDTDHITCDFVILSGGVIGTADILFQSQLRGLKLSEKLGSGFSCNGNTVAYLTGSPAPLNARGLNKMQLSKTPFQDRPGPAISSSYTSSSGFTIQKAILPMAYPGLLFEWITTYRWPCGFWRLHRIMDTLKQALGCKPSQAMILCAIGHDKSDGNISFEKGTNKLCFTPPSDPLLPRKVKAFQKLTKKLGGVLFMSKYRSTSVHLLGGCNAASGPSDGVCNPNGQVFSLKTSDSVHPGLYICDASLIPCSVGVNPCLTIAAAAEHVSRYLVQDVLRFQNGLETNLSVPRHDENPKLATCLTSLKPTVVITETMRGHIGGMPCAAYLKMKMNSMQKTGFDQKIHVMGDEDDHLLLRGKVGGHVVFEAVEKDELHIIDGEVNLCHLDQRTPYTQFMRYRLLLASSSGTRYILEGKKILSPYLFGLYAWKESTLLHVTFQRIAKKGSTEEAISLRGELRISMVGFLKSLLSMEGSGNGKGKFICLFVKTLLRTYILQVPRGSYYDFNPSKIVQRPYPRSTTHEIKTEDGFTISCRKWKCNQDKEINPVLLINGHSTESFWLPTEPNDLVRTLLAEGLEPWLLQPRLHPSNSSNHFTVEDLGRYDIPAAIKMIQTFHAPSTRVHVVAHCVGGLSIHIAMMGGHVSADHIASLCCTNSSMFFKLTTSSRVKMWLPLIPISMAILGKNTILPLFATLKTSSRHRLLKSIARLIPRYERCICDECEVFSGIFGNTFWHSNITPTLHHWLAKQSLPSLPMSAFPHLRKICNSGFIVDKNGENSYLIHPERMAVHTKYISGGRTLLVTPETSFLASKYMKLNQPRFRHERVVIDGFGHSDLLIGEESCREVFPHILSHIRLAEAEQGKDGTTIGHRRKMDSKEALEWRNDHLYEEEGNACRVSSLLSVGLLLFFIYFLVWLFLLCCSHNLP